MSVLCGFCFTCATWRKVFTPSDFFKTIQILFDYLSDILVQKVPKDFADLF